jgi:hypothetical protein
VRAAVLAAALALGPGAAAAQSFNWDDLGAAFCERSSAGDLAGLRPLITDSLAQEIAFAFGRAGSPAPATLFQSYVNPAPVCTARTRNAAIIEIRRSGPGGAAPAWTEYLVVVPEPDGATRVDDVLFATRRSDTLRARLAAVAR